MGQKVNPIGLRVGIIRDWESKWYANPKDFAPLLYEDYLIRKTIKELPIYREPRFVDKKDAEGNVVKDPKTGKTIQVQVKETINPKDIVTLSSAGIASIQIERPAINKILVTINAANPGKIIAKGGKGIDYVKKAIEKIAAKKLTGKEKLIVNVNVVEIKFADKNAQILAESIQAQIEKRVSFKRAMKQAVNKAMKAGAKGIKVRTSGRLGGAEMARVEKENAGKVPLHTLRADIDYGFAEAWTQYGHIGVKVWIYKGDVTSGRRKLEVVDKTRNNKGNRKPGAKRNFNKNGENRGNNNRGRRPQNNNKGGQA